MGNGQPVRSGSGGLWTSPIGQRGPQQGMGQPPDQETAQIQAIERQLSDLQHRRQTMARGGAQYGQLAHFDSQIRKLELQRAQLMQNAAAQQQQPQSAGEPKYATSRPGGYGSDLLGSMSRRSR